MKPSNGVVEGDDSQNGARPFTLLLPAGLPLPVLVAVPHAGRDYPQRLIANLRDEESLVRLEDRFVDQLARKVAELTQASLLIAEAPRAMIDLNRAPDDIDWSMIAGRRERVKVHSLANRRARSGLGLVPRRLPGLGEIWKRPLDRGELNHRIETVHRPYHAALGRSLEVLRDRWGAALLLDLHSMPPLRRRHAGEVQPDFVVGDRFGTSCDGVLSSLALGQLAQSGRPVAHNRPYSGGYVLDRHGAPLRGIHAMQLEICRSTYLDARMDRPTARLPAVARLVADLVKVLAGEVAGMARGSHYRQAAE